MRLDENSEFTVVGLGPGGILEGSYNVINEYVEEKAQRPGEKGYWAYLSVPSYEIFHTLVIGKAGENTVADTNFNLQLGLTQIYIEAHAELKAAIKNIADTKPVSEEEKKQQYQALMQSRQNLQEVVTGVRNSWDLQGALHVWRAHWQGGRPQKRFDQAMYQEILDAWKVLRDEMGKGDDLVGVGWLDGWIKGFLEVYGYEDDFYQQLMTWNTIHDVGDADFGHESIRLWQSVINKFRFKHRKSLSITSTMAGIKERMAQFRVMIMDPGSYHGWAAGGWYWQVKTDQFRSLATQLMDLEFRQRLQEQPEGQHKFGELDRLALDVYKQETIDSFKNSRKSLQAARMINVWHATFALLANYDMICTGYLWSYIRSTSQMDTDVFILNYQEVDVKKGGWTCPVTVDLVANFQIGLRGFMKRRAESRVRRKKNSKLKPKTTPQDGEESGTAAQASGKSKTGKIQEQECSNLGSFEDAELIHDDGKRMDVKQKTPYITKQPNPTPANQSSGRLKHQIDGENTSRKSKKKKSSKKKGKTNAERASEAPIPASTGDLMEAVADERELAPDIANSNETTDIDDAWQAAKQHFIGQRIESEGAKEEPVRDSFLDDAERLRKMDLPQPSKDVETSSPLSKALSTLDWFDDSQNSSAADDDWYSATVKQMQSETNTPAGNTMTENQTKLRPGVQWSQLLGGGTKKVAVSPGMGSDADKTQKQGIKKVTVLTTEEKPNTNISRTNDQAKKSSFTSGQKGKGIAGADAKELRPAKKDIQGPIGHILPSIGPWTEVMKKKKQVATESEPKNSAGTNRPPGKPKLSVELKMGVDGSNAPTKVPTSVSEPKMKDISNLLNPSGNWRMSRPTEMDPLPTSRNVLRIVTKTAQSPRSLVESSAKSSAMETPGRSDEPATADVITELPLDNEPTSRQPTPKPLNDPQERHPGVESSPVSPEKTPPASKLLATKTQSLTSTIESSAESVNDTTGKDTFITETETESLPVPFPPNVSIPSAAEASKALLSVAGPDVGSPAVAGDTKASLESSVDTTVPVPKSEKSEGIDDNFSVGSMVRETTKQTKELGMLYQKQASKILTIEQRRKILHQPQVMKPPQWHQLHKGGKCINYLPRPLSFIQLMRPECLHRVIRLNLTGFRLQMAGNSVPKGWIGTR